MRRDGTPAEQPRSKSPTTGRSADQRRRPHPSTGSEFLVRKPHWIFSLPPSAAWTQRVHGQGSSPVFLAYAAGAGWALIDRELYLPRAWTDDRDRTAGIGDELGFSAQPKLARRMPTGALPVGVPARWRGADEVYGCDKRLHVWRGQAGRPHVPSPGPARHRRVPRLCGMALDEEV